MTQRHRINAQSPGDCKQSLVPKESPAHLPVQDLRRNDWTAGTAAEGFTLRHAFFFLPPVLLAMVLTGLLYTGLSDYPPVLKLSLAFLFCINAWWLAAQFMTALLGLFVNLQEEAHNIAVPSAIYTKTAILFPTYCEVPERIVGTAIATLRALDGQGVANSFEVFILSDTNVPEIWAREEELVRLALAEMDLKGRLWYRRRSANVDKKCGNISEWCRRWGGAFDYMIVFDADSLMSAQCLVELVRAIQSSPSIALIQTPSILINRQTVFGRSQQFANYLYGYWSPLLTAGMAFWHCRSSSYWGHNAIVRVDAFCACAGVPHLPGKPPLGGHIMSHDFVEAALLRRAGWRIRLAPRMEQSFEEAPPSILEWAVRERRWCQGALQHLRILTASGLCWISRAHLLFGIMYSASSAAWVLFCLGALLLGLGAPQRNLELLPVWMFAQPSNIVALVVVLISLAALPRAFGCVLALRNRHCQDRQPSARTLLVSAAIETLMSIVFVHIRILWRALACCQILLGRDFGWRPQRRNDDDVSAHVFFRFHAWHMATGGCLIVFSYLSSPTLFLWLLPASCSLIVSGGFSAICGRTSLGGRARAAGLFVTPEEDHPPEIVVAAQTFRATLTTVGSHPTTVDPGQNCGTKLS